MMRASKENADQATTHLAQVEMALHPWTRRTVAKQLDFLKEFLRRAKAKLPTEAAFAKEVCRK